MVGFELTCPVQGAPIHASPHWSPTDRKESATPSLPQLSCPGSERQPPTHTPHPTPTKVQQSTDSPLITSVFNGQKFSNPSSPQLSCTNTPPHPFVLQQRFNRAPIHPSSLQSLTDKGSVIPSSPQLSCLRPERESMPHHSVSNGQRISNPNPVLVQALFGKVSSSKGWG